MRRMLTIFSIGAIVAVLASPAWAVPLRFVPPDGAVTADHPAPASSGLLLRLLAVSAGAVGITIRKDIGSIAQKFVTRAQAAAGDYKTGVAGAGSTWESNTAASEAAYDAGVQQAITTKKFGKGVVGKAGKYQTNAVNLGSARYGPGVANAQQAYAAGMAPVLQVLQGIQLPPKSFRGSPGNQQRANVVATALAAMRANR
jgi:hypothetical protein